MNKLHRDLIKVVDKAFNLTDKEHKEILQLYDESRKNINQFVADLYMRYADDGLLDYDDYLSNHEQRTESLITQEVSKIASTEATLTVIILGSVLSLAHNKTAYTLDRQFNFNAGVKFNLLRPEVVDTIVNYNWSGIPFSERIWNNSNMLVRGLRQELAQGLQAGESIDKMARRINKQFNSKAYQSQRLIRTESARVITEAHERIYEEIGIDEVMWLATLEGNTCSECSALDGERFKLDEDTRPIPPLHPNCRCAYVPIPFDDYKTTDRKDNVTKNIIDYITYEEWIKNKSL